MSNAKVMLSCQKVSILYQVGDFKNIGLKEWVMRRLTGRYEVINFWADKDVTFSLNKGDMLGIIGLNGAGKSTLLKAVSGIMEPTSGTISRRGNVVALLELASGFDGDLNVKENAYLRGAMLGYTRAFMDKTYPDIIEFAELKEFEDRPFKQLSSGMKSRLAFAIASLVKPEILILDEVLAVGDGAFRKKSEAKMREIIKGGATTILVSHSTSQVRSLCNKVLWLDKGRQVVCTDDVGGACDCYDKFLRGASPAVYIPHAPKARIDMHVAENITPPVAKSQVATTQSRPNVAVGTGKGPGQKAGVPRTPIMPFRRDVNFAKRVTERKGTGEIKYTAADFYDQFGRPIRVAKCGQLVRFVVSFSVVKGVPAGTVVGFDCCDQSGKQLISLNLHTFSCSLPALKAGANRTVEFSIHIPLNTGKYSWSVNLRPNPDKPNFYDYCHNAAMLTVVKGSTRYSQYQGGAFLACPASISFVGEGRSSVLFRK